MSIDEPPLEEVPLLVAPGMHTKPHHCSWMLMEDFGADK